MLHSPVNHIKINTHPSMTLMWFLFKFSLLRTPPWQLWFLKRSDLVLEKGMEPLFLFMITNPQLNYFLLLFQPVPLIPDIKNAKRMKLLPNLFKLSRRRNHSPLLLLLLLIFLLIMTWFFIMFIEGVKSNVLLPNLPLFILLDLLYPQSTPPLKILL